LNRLTPAMFMLPMFSPAVFQRFYLSSFYFLILADPFVRFFFCFYSSFSCPIWVLPRYYFASLQALFSYNLLLFIINIVAALALWGAIP
jgi:hypothetical protein